MYYLRYALCILVVIVLSPVMAFGFVLHAIYDAIVFGALMWRRVNDWISPW